MKKIKLTVEDLAVTSIEMEGIADGTGTVHAASDSNWDCISNSCPPRICVPDSWWVC